jgi:hypothetical protein
MYRDNSLVPKEAIRLAALGTLARRPQSYTEVASEVRQFAGLVVGPSLDLLGTSIELLKFEGLISADPNSDASAESAADPDLVLTDAGQQALHDYLTARLRPGGSDVNRLVLSLKLRFLDLLNAEDRADQVEGLCDMYRAELARLEELRAAGPCEEGALANWIEFEIDQVRARLDWCETLNKGS